MTARNQGDGAVPLSSHTGEVWAGSGNAVAFSPTSSVKGKPGHPLAVFFLSGGAAVLSRSGEQSGRGSTRGKSGLGQPEGPNPASEKNTAMTSRRILWRAGSISLAVHLFAGLFVIHIFRTAPVLPLRRSLDFRVIRPAEAPVVLPPVAPPAFSQPKPSSAPKNLPKPRRKTPQRPALLLPPPASVATQTEERLTLKEPSVPALPKSEALPPVAAGPAAGSSDLPSATQSVPGSSGPEGHGMAMMGGAGTEPPGSDRAHREGGEDASEGLPVGSPAFDADYLSNPTPSYPPAARRLGIQGEVVIRVLVNPDGKPENLQLQKSSGSSLLDNAALSAVKHWSFVPARRGDKPVSAWVDVPIHFRLN